MQYPAAGMALMPVQMPDLAVGIVHEYEWLGIHHYVAPAIGRRPDLIRQKK